MSENLVIVESPAKTKTLRKHLGKGFKLMASYGHVRDLKPKGGAVDPNNNFKMIYEVIARNKKYLDAIIDVLKTEKIEILYLATDPDREGEAIAWHLYELCKAAGVLNNVQVYRIAFNEITKSAIQEAIKNPRELSQHLINAQQARRALDYLVGFELSPLLWKKVRRGLSAGRVQSPALRLIADRQQEILEFKSTEYWTINAETKVDNNSNQLILAKLVNFKNKKLTKFAIQNSEQANTISNEITLQAQGYLIVEQIKKTQRKKTPPAPFITSTLQQEAARKLGFSAQKTMRTAQQLYEGINLGKEATGLITYMRTDSTQLSKEAVEDIRGFIGKKYGAKFVPDTIPVFKSRSKNAQEAHEAVRTTEVSRLPSIIKDNLSKEQFQLYELIWQRTVACQMINAIYDQVSIDLVASSAAQSIFRTTGSVLREPGFLKVYQEGRESGDNYAAEQDSENDITLEFLPDLELKQKLILSKISPEQHFTEAPPKYSEASLVKTLEEYGIGRPSTYATILSTLQARGYAELEKRRFIPTEVGMIVNKFLTKYFNNYVDYDFTAKLEDQLDAVARGEENWQELLSKFWLPFNELVKQIESSVDRKDVTHEQMDENCPKCENKLSIRLGKRGRFIGCTNYPECDYTRSIEQSREESLAEPEIITDRNCPDCNSELQYKQGPYGKFIGCSGYPNCKFIESMNKNQSTGIQCPSCNSGNLVKKKSRFGTFFYSCDAYPKCKYAISSEPLDQSCPQCNWKILMLKTTKRRGTERVCPQKDCDFAEQVSDPN